MNGIKIKRVRGQTRARSFTQCSHDTWHPLYDLGPTRDAHDS